MIYIALITNQQEKRSEKIKCLSVTIVFKEWLTKLINNNKRLHFETNLLMDFDEEVILFQERMLICWFLQISIFLKSNEFRNRPCWTSFTVRIGHGTTNWTKKIRASTNSSLFIRFSGNSYPRNTNYWRTTCSHHQSISYWRKLRAHLLKTVLLLS